MWLLVTMGKRQTKSKQRRRRRASLCKLVTKLEKELKNANSAVQELLLGGCQNYGPSLGP